MRFFSVLCAAIFFSVLLFYGSSFAGMLDTAGLSAETSGAALSKPSGVYGPAGATGALPAAGNDARVEGSATDKPRSGCGHGENCRGHRLVRSNLVIVYGKAAGAGHEEIKKAVADSAIFETLVEHLADFIELPSELKIRLLMLGEENAYYDPAKKEILISYELLKQFSDMVDSSGGMSDDEKAELFVDIAFFVTLHELGHALIDIFDLPITGREEDVADQLASWFILKTFGDDDHQAVLALVNASEWFVSGFLDPKTKVEDIEFADGHSLDPQRFYNIIAWAYGFNPDAAAAAIGGEISDFLPEERIEAAAAEFERLDRSFGVLLEKYLKK